MREVHATVTVADNCPGASYVLASVTSDRIYTIGYAATDASDNAAQSSAAVVVLHSKKP
jgi:hypothetical protein